MSSDSTQFRTPSQHIEALLKDRGWSNRVLAVVLVVEENWVSRLVTGKRTIDAELAVTLEEVFGVSAERFLELQKAYDLAKARISVRPDPGRPTRAHLYAGLPVAEMNKRGWIDAPDVRDVDKVQNELMRFFAVNRVDDIEILPHAAKKTQVNTPVTPTQLAWLYHVKQIASEMLVARYSPASVKSAIAKLKTLLAAAEEARKVPRILAESGIRFLSLISGQAPDQVGRCCGWVG